MTAPAQQSRRGGVAVFLFSDIAGSTLRWERFPADMADALARHDRLMRDAMAANGGEVFKTMGDAFFVAFPSPIDALAAAAAAQRALAEEDFGAVGGLGVRMAVHAGEAEPRDGDYFGQPLNRVARLLSVAHPGQILLSGVAAELVRGALPAELSLRDLGVHRLRDLSEPEHVHQLAGPGLQELFPALRSLTTVPNNLPAQTSSFLGREAATSDLVADLATHRLVTLVGAGGMGKTRLALHVAAEVADRYSDGVWLVELAAVSDGARIPDEVAAVIGLTVPAGRRAADVVLTYLKGQRSLLLLDNCEHLVGAAAALAANLLRSCATLTILATSREALGIQGEYVSAIAPLAVPRRGEAPTAAAAREFSAVRLFEERAAAALGGYRLEDADAAVVGAICYRLDGIALAIELAAPRLKMLKPGQLLARLDGRFRVLSGGPRTSMPRQQTLQALIDWSHDLLAPGEKLLMRRLSVFAGGWTLEAATAVAADDRLPAEEIFEHLASLVDKSLVVVDRSGSDPRYRFLETTRGYSAERLMEAGEAGWPRRLALHLIDHLREGETRFQSQPRLVTKETEPELDNLRAALAWAFGPDGDIPLGVALTAYAQWLWTDLSLSQERRQWCELAARHLARETPAGVASRIHGGLSSRMRAGLRSSRDDGQAALEHARAAGEPLLIARALANKAIAELTPSATEASRTFLGEALGIVHAFGDTRLLATILNSLGVVEVFAGNLAEGRRRYEDGLAVVRRLSDLRAVNLISTNLADLAFLSGDVETAIGVSREAAEAARQIGDRRSECVANANLASYLILGGDLGGARAAAHQSLRSWAAVAEPIHAAISLQVLALAAALAGDAARSARLLGFADAVYAAEGLEREATERMVRERAAAALSAALDEGATKTLMVEGAAMPVETAVALGLAEPT